MGLFVAQDKGLDDELRDQESFLTDLFAKNTDLAEVLEVAELRQHAYDASLQGIRSGVSKFRDKEFPSFGIPCTESLYVAIHQRGVIGRFWYQGRDEIRSAVIANLLGDAVVQKHWSEDHGYRAWEAENLGNLVASEYVYYAESKLMGSPEQR